MSKKLALFLCLFLIPSKAGFRFAQLRLRAGQAGLNDLELLRDVYFNVDSC